MSSNTHTSREWKEFIVGKIFDGVQNSKAYHKAELHEKEFGLPYVSRTNANNGLEAIIDNNSNFSINQANTIVFGAENAEFFYQPYQYITGNKMYYIESQKLNKHTGLFVQKMLSNSIERCGFGYGKGLTGTRMKNRTIVLPIDETGNPDRSYMESYMRQLEHDKLQAQADSYFRSKLASLHTPGDITPLSEKAWDEFEIGKLFHLKQGKSKGLNHLKIIKNGVNYLGATNRNNGVLCQVEKNKTMIQKGNCIAFIRNGEGSMGYSIYKSEEFIATSDISVGYSDFLTKHVGIFITTLADKVRGKYNFGYKRSDTRLKKEKILLPITDDGSPDYAYMEQYMQQIEYRLVQRYLETKERMRG